MTISVQLKNNKMIQSSFSLIQPSFIKFVELAQFDKTCHAWQVMESVIV